MSNHSATPMATPFAQGPSLRQWGDHESPVGPIPMGHDHGPWWPWEKPLRGCCQGGLLGGIVLWPGVALGKQALSVKPVALAEEGWMG